MTDHDDALALGEDDLVLDPQLSAMFDDAAPDSEDPVFTAHVVSKLNATDRTRLFALGGAGAAGAAVAGSQLESLISGPVAALDAMMGQAAGFVGPEAIVTALFAVLALGVAWIVPKGRLGAI